MSAANARQVLDYFERKREEARGRNLCIGQDIVAAALGVPVNTVAQLLDSLAEAGKVHRVSPGCWSLGAGRMGKW